MNIRKLTALLAALALAVSLVACGDTDAPTGEDSPVSIVLSDESITVNGAAAGTDSAAAVYVAHDIVYYEAGQGIAYGKGTAADEHTADEAAAHTVVHITEAGTYTLSGTLTKGQIAVDLGEDAKDDPSAVVTLILNGVDITCEVAPAVIFYSVYECGSDDTATATRDVDTSAAGANVYIADGTVNNVSGSYVARIYKPDTVVLSEDGTEVEEAKKLHKYDGAFYSKMSMNVSGAADVNEAGTLNITAENEGLDSELHLTINGGCINITAGNDGINTNEDGVSVTTVNGGMLTVLVTGETGEGDGIDSNGWLVINGGSVLSYACSTSPDSGLDADNGIHLNGGTVIATGNMLDAIDESAQGYAVFAFAETQKGGQAIRLKNEAGETMLYVAPENDYLYLVVSSPDLTAGDYTLWRDDEQLAGESGGGIMGGGMRPEMPEGMELPDNRELPEGAEPPMGGDGQQPPEKPEGEMPNMDEMPQPPEKPEGMDFPEDMPQMPQGGGMMGGMMGGQMGDSGERSTTFTLTDGGSFFTGISAAE